MKHTSAQFNHVVCGGTFDHLHLGHEKLLNECLSLGKKVTVGITTRAAVRHKGYIFSLQPYRLRVKNVTDFNSRLTPYLLKDIYGPTITDGAIDAICVTQETLFGAELINKKRIEIGMKPLSIITVQFAFDQMNEKISSEHIRQGIVDRQGIRYDHYIFSKEKHILPEYLKRDLRNPLGRVISSFSKLSKYQISRIRSDLTSHGYFYHCAVGDMVTLELKKRDVGPFISIIDGITQRKALKRALFDSFLEKDRYNAKNEKGTIQKNACIQLRNMFNMGHGGAIKQLFVRGEEDLLTLPAVLLAPLGAHIWYGQRGVGAVDIHVTEKKKQTVYNLLRRFE